MGRRRVNQILFDKIHVLLEAFFSRDLEKIHIPTTKIQRRAFTTRAGSGFVAEPFFSAYAGSRSPGVLFVRRSKAILRRAELIGHWQDAATELTVPSGRVRETRPFPEPGSIGSAWG